MTLCRVIAPFNHSPQIQARILIGSVRALSGTFHDFRASGGNTQRVHYPPATASCDTLCVRHPFAARFGLRRASRPPVDPSPTILRPHHPAPPAPPRPSGKRATSPLQPFDRPRFLFLTSLPPPLPVHHVCPRGRFVGLASLELAWRSTRTVYSSSPPAPPPAPSPSSSNCAPGRAGYCIRPFHSRAAVPPGSPNRTSG